jgi:hypothetical protein
MFDLNYFNMVSEPDWSNPWLANFMELAASIEIMFANVRATTGIKIVIFIHFIPSRMFQHVQCVQFLQKKFRVIFCLPLLQNLVFRLSFSFYNLVFLFCLCNCFGISSSLQFLQFGICVQFLQIFLV